MYFCEWIKIANIHLVYLLFYGKQNFFEANLRPGLSFLKFQAVDISSLKISAHQCQ